MAFKHLAQAQLQNFRYLSSQTTILLIKPTLVSLEVNKLAGINKSSHNLINYQSQRIVARFLSATQAKQSKMASKFCANLSFMFTDVPFVERYAAAKRAGFKAVESGFPYQVPIEEVVNAKTNAGIQQILVNVYTGDVTKGELGFAAIPGEEDNFKKSINTTIDYAKALGASKIHVMSGKVGNPTTQNDVVYEDNLRYAVKLFEKHGIMGVIEPINKYSVPGYYMNSYDKAINVIKSINSPNLRLLMDIFHLQHIQGNITRTLNELKDFIGHVQIAQVPDRNEPETAGEINYSHVLNALRTIGYDDWIGLEYKPQGDPVVGLRWVKNLGYEL